MTSGNPIFVNEEQVTSSNADVECTSSCLIFVHGLIHLMIH